MSQVGIPGKQPLRWRLSCKRFIWQCPWNKQLVKGIERSRMDGKEVICNAVLVEVSANRLGSSEVGMALQSYRDLVVGDRSLLSSH